MLAMRLPEVKLMTDDQLVAAFRWKEAVNGFFEAVDEVLTERLTTGGRVLDIKLVNGRSNRQWKDENAVVSQFGEQAYERKLRSPSKLEAVVGKKAGVDNLTYKPEPRKIVVLDTDARPEASSPAHEVFGVIEGQKVETSDCVECDILGTCGRHMKKEVVTAGSKAPMWPQ